ncbi:MAG: hypothetical protein GX147_09380 [Deltaproteobacteria bacterium]|jgi:uncharacterized FlaG/YvyC family protein|nr:hypothetical protein [Deltaproteobacteria bacterium]
MGQLYELEKHVNELVSELSEIIQRLQKDIANAKKAVSFDQVKAIENSIARMKRQGVPVPPELSALKIKLFSEHELHQGRVDLHRKIQERIGDLLQRETPLGQRRKRIDNPKLGGLSHRKPPNYEKPLGSKGNKNLEDYLIPVIRLMWSGLDHIAAFRSIAQKLDVRYNTVSSQCTRALDLTTDEFIRQVRSKSIVDLLKRKYQDQYWRIKTELKP